MQIEYLAQPSLRSFCPLWSWTNEGLLLRQGKKNWGWLTMGMHNLYRVWTSCENGPKMFLYKLGSMNWRWSLAFIIAQAALGASGSEFSDSVSSQPLDLKAQLSVSITKVRLCLLSQPSSAAPWFVGWAVGFPLEMTPAKKGLVNLTSAQVAHCLLADKPCMCL